MKILFLHRDDSPELGPWARQSWDRVVDLGIGGPECYARWAQRLGCPVSSLHSLWPGVGRFRAIRELFAKGLGRLQDREGLDWWELTIISFHQQLEDLVLLCEFVADLAPSDEVFVTKPGFHSTALESLMSGRLQYFPRRSSSVLRVPLRYLHSAWKLRFSQWSDVFWDKYDLTYRVRGSFSSKRKASDKPVVLLPSAYVNVSRIGMAYANTFSEANFLLVTTRQSGRVSAPPANVAVAGLSSYASHRPSTDREYEELLGKWSALRRDLESVPEFDVLGRIDILDSFPRQFRDGLAIRDAWRAVLEREPVEAVLCGDDSNAYTHIPLLLAKERNIPTIACHHGALDGRYLMKRAHADVILAKGKMEQDYLTRVCGLSQEKVEVGAPTKTPSSHRIARATASVEARSQIVFFSESYEVASGRCEEFYRDVLPPLADVAVQTGRTLVIKLHPFESPRERERMIARVLSPAQRNVTTVVAGPLDGGLLQKTWFAVTVLSTVAIECTLAGVPCFLCSWLNYIKFDYIEQFSRFGVGQVLQSAEQIQEIPQLLERLTLRPEVARDLWQPIQPGRFEELVGGRVRLQAVGA